jgi:hypothetical protein
MQIAGDIITEQHTSLLDSSEQIFHINIICFLYVFFYGTYFTQDLTQIDKYEILVGGRFNIGGGFEK